MLNRLQNWLHDLPYHDPVNRRQAFLLQAMALSLGGATLLILPTPFGTTQDSLGRLLLLALLGVVLILSGTTLIFVRRSYLNTAALILALGLVGVLSGILYGVSFEKGAVVLFAFSLPIAIGGLLSDRRGLLIILNCSIIGVALTVYLERANTPGSGFVAVAESATAASVVAFSILTILLGLFISNVRSFERNVRANQQSRERELERLSRQLESKVRERTADLEMALSTLEQRTAEQERLLAENRRQAAAIRAISVPILPVTADTIVMPLIGNFDHERLQLAQEQALGQLERSGARHLLLDISGVPVVDTLVAQGIIQMLQAARLLGAGVALIGVRPEVAQAIVSLGLDLGPLHTYADLRTALSRIATL